MYHFIIICESGLGSSKVLVLDTWRGLLSTWYLLVLDLLKFKSTWYLLVLDGQSTWYLSKYLSTFVKLTNIQSWICEFVLVNNSPMNTISRNGSYWVCWEHMSRDVNSQGWTVSLIYSPRIETRWPNILTKFWRALVQVETCLQFGASHYNQIDKL